MLDWLDWRERGFEVEVEVEGLVQVVRSDTPRYARGLYYKLRCLVN